jgi:nucleoside-diphosphate-sugar epimerase
VHILVTGHNGYADSVLVPMLRRAGHEVVGVDPDLYADCWNGRLDDDLRWREAVLAR